MKPMYLSIAIGLMIVLSANIKAEAQSNQDLVSTFPALARNVVTHSSTSVKKLKNKSANINPRILNQFINSNRNIQETKITGVNVKAIRDFSRSYKDVGDVKWFESESGFIASFFTNGINTKVFYDQKGSWFYSLRSYNETGMTFNIRDMVKRTYYDHEIIGVYEFDFSTITIYLIRMQDKQSNFLTLMVYDGQIEELP